MNVQPISLKLLPSSKAVTVAGSEAVSSETTWRGKRAKKKVTARQKPRPLPTHRRTACTARGACSAKHAGAVVERPCVVCCEPTAALQTVLAWDVPCCLKHDLHRDYRVEVRLPWGRPPVFLAHRRIEVVS